LLKIGKIMKQRLNSLIQRQEFNPGLLGIFINPFYFARRGLYQHIVALAPNIKGRVLDVGCGSKPYLSLFPASEYIGMEISGGNTNADCYYDGNHFPFQECEFDSVLTNEVLEHVFNPEVFLSEVNRVLKGGGVLLLTVPFVWDEHEQPYDYARYSSFGLRHLLEQNGFIILEYRKSMNDIRVIFQMMNAYTYKKTINGNFYLNIIITLILMAPFNLLGEILGWILPCNNDLYLDNVVLARKDRSATHNELEHNK
jgi:SAM-dependent methyltransferase